MDDVTVPSKKIILILKRLINYVSYTLVILSAVFLIYKFYSLQGLINLKGFITDHSIIFTLACLVYAINNYLLAAGWRSILKGLDELVSIKMATTIFGVSQIAKYIPGNIFQFAGKQVLAVRYDLNSAAVAKSQFFEVIVLLLSALPFSIYVGVYHFTGLSFLLSVLSFVLIFFIISIILHHFGFCFLISFLHYSLFMFISGVLFFLLMNSSVTINNNISTYLFVISSFVAAWLAGFVMPGSPAGLGVRESILILLLFPLFRDQSIVFNVAILIRLVTVIGDLIFFLFSFSIQRLIDGERKSKKIQ